VGFSEGRPNKSFAEELFDNLGKIGYLRRGGIVGLAGF